MCLTLRRVSDSRPLTKAGSHKISATYKWHKRCFSTPRMLKRKMYSIAMGLVLAHASIAQLTPRYSSTDCVTCGRTVETGFPTPTNILPLNQNLAAQLNGFSHGDVLPQQQALTLPQPALAQSTQSQAPLLQVPTFTPKLLSAFYPMQANGQRQDLRTGASWHDYNQLLNVGLGQPVFSNRVFAPVSAWYGGPSYIF